ncbi:MAG: response regulator [Planctomycetota bacterium]|nr:response regulator [Planctomycetota bacterium]
MLHDPVFDIFREEAREHLGAVEKLFLDLEAATTTEDRRELIDGLFRRAHSLKGDAKVVGLDTLKQLAQQLEDALDELRASPDTVNPTAISQGLAQFDRIREAFEAWERSSADQSADAAAVPEVPVSTPPPVVEPAPVSSEPVPVASASAVGRDGESGSSGPWPGTQLGRTEAGSPPAVPLVVADSNSRETPGPPALLTESRTPAASATGSAEETFTVRVPSERLDRMLNLAGELRISQRSGDTVRKRLSDLVEQIVKLPLGKLSSPAAASERPQAVLRTWQSALLDQVRRIETELSKNRSREELKVLALETDIRDARLLPLVMLTDSLRRAVRDLSQALGKSICYEADVGNILLDKAVIEALRDPLLHLVRNAADHGLETPSERVQAGKPETGVIRILASRRGELVRITISDDGRGVGHDRIRARLRQLGELDEAELRQLTEAELREHLFRPGFTTAKPGDISGRGVGLDVVRHTVQRLQGRVEIEATSPAGTTFALTVPVTISTVRILTVLSGGHYYGVPSSAILRTGRAKQADLRELEGQLVLPLDGAPVRWVHLADLVGAVALARASHESAWSYLLMAHRGQRTAVAVDDLEDETEVLLKPLGFPLGGLPGIVGATIRADGSVQLVLDLVSSAWSHGVSAPPRAEAQVARRILVVDDSPTTRAVLRNVFTAAGYVVCTASDGAEALERLRSQAFDLVVTDVEMPRLNGLDLTRQIKAKFGLPVILVTGKEKEEHRREGLEAGADAYVVKSTFQGDGLLDIVQQFV